jgi:hypothetical protein
MVKNRFKIFYLFLKIINDVRYYSIKIQSYYRMKRVQNDIKEIFEMLKHNYCIFYYICEDKKHLIAHDVKIKIIYEKKDRIYNFVYNDILKCFLLFINKDNCKLEKYRFYFLINDRVVIDTNFPREYNIDGNYYNILDVRILNEKGYINNILKRELILKRKYTDPFLKIDNYLKPILKKSHDHLVSPQKRVSFNLSLNNTYL